MDEVARGELGVAGSDIGHRVVIAAGAPWLKRS
jgi:hypothetical protein